MKMRMQMIREYVRLAQDLSTLGPVTLRLALPSRSQPAMLAKGGVSSTPSLG